MANQDNIPKLIIFFILLIVCFTMYGNCKEMLDVEHFIMVKMKAQQPKRPFKPGFH